MIIRRFDLDIAQEKAVARLRLVAAVVVLIGSALAFATMRHTARWVLLALGLIASAAWIVSAMRSRTRVRHQDRHTLSFDDSGIAHGIGRVAWSAVQSIEVDEELLVVKIVRRAGEPLRVEPNYGGLSVYALAETLRAAWEAHRHPGPEAYELG